MSQPRYSFWKLWEDNEGREWAEPYHAVDSTAARRAHADAKRFEWGTTGQRRRMVTELHAHDGVHGVIIADNAHEDEVGKPEAWHHR